MQERCFPFWTGNLAHNRKIEQVYEYCIRRNRVAGGAYDTLPYPWIASGDGLWHYFAACDAALCAMVTAAVEPEWTREMFRNFWHWMTGNPNFPEGSPGYGMIPGMVRVDHGPYFWTFKLSQTPLWAWAVWEAYRQDPKEAGWAPMGEERTQRTYRNHWHWMEHHPNFPEGSPGYGMIPGVVVTDRSPDFFTFKYTQLPLTAWGVWMVYGQEGNRAFVEESLPYLRKYHRWYVSERDIDADLLIEVGSYTGEVQHARFEGLDFKPSLDRMRMTNRQGQLTGDRWYGDVELVEMTCFVIRMEKVLAEFEERVGDGEAAGRYRNLATQREAALNRWTGTPMSPSGSRR